jgi:hypothetical protein
MPVKENTPHFQYELGSFMDRARAYGGGKTIRKIAEEHPDTISLSTLKKLMAGQHVLPKQFLQSKGLFRIKPLDWIEAKIRYVESYIGEYLVQLKENQIEDKLDHIDLEAFFKKRSANKVVFPNRRVRLQWAVETYFNGAGLAPADISDDVGKSGKRNMHSISYPTVTAIRRGEHIKPAKFNLVCRRLGVEKEQQSIAKVLYAEAFIGDYLLGEDPKTFRSLSPYAHPRTCALLIFSTEESLILP